MAERSFYLLVYDIVDDRRRTKVAKAMKSLGERVQRSVFEAYLTDKELAALIKRMEKLLDQETDSLRIYALCSGCRQKVAMVGLGAVTEPPGLMIV